MSESLLAQVFSKSVHTLLAEVDAELENAFAHRDGYSDARRGPFGAFGVLPALQAPEHAESPDVSAFIANFFSKVDDVGLPNEVQSQPIIVHNSAWLNDSEENDIASFLGMQGETYPTQSTAPRVLRQRSTTLGRSNAYTHLHDRSPSPLLGFTLSAARVPPVLPPADATHDAPILLKYYVDVVIPLLTPFKHGKTPWHILFLPLAKATLASITIGEIQDDANLGAFYGTLSLSALHLFAVSHNRKWSEQANIFKEAAHQHIASVQPKTYSLPKVFKYKVVVMMLLTMAQLSVSLQVQDLGVHHLTAPLFLGRRRSTRPD